MRTINNLEEQGISTMMMSLLPIAAGFLIGPVLCFKTTRIRYRNRLLPLHDCEASVARARQGASSLASSTLHDYEYLPPRRSEAAPPVSAEFLALPSTYPPDTPPGLRGEAVRSALRSDRCVGYNLQGTPLELGLVRVRGTGTLDFCHTKLSKAFTEAATPVGSYRDACLLTTRGHLLDRIGVAVTGSAGAAAAADGAFLMTSPGHAAQALWNRLDPFVFALDRVVLSVEEEPCLFTLASTRLGNVRTAFDTFMRPWLARQRVELPRDRYQCTFVEFGGGGSGSDDGSGNNDRIMGSLLILPTTLLPDCVGRGYTFCFLGKAAATGRQIWQSLIAEENEQGPIDVGARELRTLQVEAGWPTFGHEMTGHVAAKHKSSPSTNEAAPPPSAPTMTPASPLELHLEALIDEDKGCYLGQEGVASILKNPRGAPRTLYQVVFEDDFNVYDHESAEDDPLENLTRMPMVGDTLYVLGSNQEIAVGTMTSVAEGGGTGDRFTLGLVLARRADSILRQMKARDITLDMSRVKQQLKDGKRLEDLAFRDPLDGLEVIVGDSYTVGRLQTVPSRRFKPSENMFDEEAVFSDDSGENDEDKRIIIKRIKSYEDGNGDERPPSTGPVAAPALQAQAGAAALEAEAKRKAEKMERLRKQAEEALARRRSKNQ